jgi:hypothetical protein
MKSGGIFKTNLGGKSLGAFALVVMLASSTPASATGVGKLVNDVCKKTTDQAYRAKYCSAAKDLKQGRNANFATSAVWTGVSVACGAACGKATGSIVCKIASSGGTAGEGVITKKFTDALMGEGSKWGGEALSGAKSADGAATAATDTVESKGGVNADACQTAGTSALKAYGKFSDSKNNEKSLAQLRDQTKDMNTPTGQNQVGYTGDTQNSGDHHGESTSAATAGKDEVCSDAAISTALGAIRCAAHSDPSLPPYVKSEEFVKDLQKATGKSPDEFFANYESPAKSIFDSPAVNALPEGRQKGLADSLSAMEGCSASKSARVANSGSSGTGGYSSAGGKKSAADDDTGFDMNGMIAGVLGQVGGKPDGEGADTTTGELTIGRRPASGNYRAAEDPKISIFDRVQWRYGAISARDRLGAP